MFYLHAFTPLIFVCTHGALRFPRCVLSYTPKNMFSVFSPLGPVLRFSHAALLLSPLVASTHCNNRCCLQALHTALQSGALPSQGPSSALLTRMAQGGSRMGQDLRTLCAPLVQQALLAHEQHLVCFRGMGGAGEEQAAGEG